MIAGGDDSLYSPHCKPGTWVGAGCGASASQNSFVLRLAVRLLSHAPSSGSIRNGDAPLEVKQLVR